MKICDREVRVDGELLRIARLAAEKYEFLDEPEAMIEGLRASGVRADLFTFMQKLPETEPKYGYPMEWDNLAVLPVTTYEAWWKDVIDNKTRNMVRKAERKGVVTREVAFDEALLEGIWQIYNECPVRQGKAFRHYGKDLETVRQETATLLERSVFLGAFIEKRLIGFVKLTWDQAGTQAGMMNIVSLVKERDKAPTNALVAQAVRSCAERGIPYLFYASFSYGKKQQDSLSDFKKNNGFRRVDLPRYYVALTRLGRLAFALKLHRGAVEYLPEPLLARVRGLRRLWYNRKLSTFSASS